MVSQTGSRSGCPTKIPPCAHMSLALSFHAAGRLEGEKEYSFPVILVNMMEALQRKYHFVRFLNTKQMSKCCKFVAVETVTVSKPCSPSAHARCAPVSQLEDGASMRP
jgi:hypothetical protein